MIQVVSDCIHDFLLLFKNFWTWFFGDNNFGNNYGQIGLSIGIAIAVIFVAINIIKKVVWSR